MEFGVLPPAHNNIRLEIPMSLPPGPMPEFTVHRCATVATRIGQIRQSWPTIAVCTRAISSNLGHVPRRHRPAQLKYQHITRQTTKAADGLAPPRLSVP